MNITSVNVRLMDERAGKVRANMSVTLDNCIAVHDILIVEGERGLMMCMPSRRCTDGRYRDVVHPISQEARADLSAFCMQEYESARRQMMRRRG